MKSALKNILFVLSSLYLVSCGPSGSENVENSNNPEENVRVIPVEVQVIKEEKVTRTLQYTADISAFKVIYYAPASPGRIKNIHVEVGSRVQKGDVLVEMDQTQLHQAITQLENARFNFLRIDTLYQLGSISEQTYEQTKTQYELARSNVEFLTENTTLVSPVDGIVTAKYYEDGEIYSGAPNTAVGKAAVVTLMQINPLKAIVSVSQQYFSAVKAGMEAKLTLDIFPDKEFHGEIMKIYPTIDPFTRTFQIEIIIENDQEILRPGMFGEFELQLRDEETILVPAIAVLKQEGTNNRYVFMHQDGMAQQIEVTLGKRIDDRVEIISSQVKSGMELVVTGQANLLNGSPIRVVENETEKN